MSARRLEVGSGQDDVLDFRIIMDLFLSSSSQEYAWYYKQSVEIYVRELNLSSHSCANVCKAPFQNVLICVIFPEQYRCQMNVLVYSSHTSITVRPLNHEAREVG